MYTEMIIESIGLNEQTGHVSVQVYSKTTDGTASWLGPKRTYGVDAVAFRNRFNGDVDDVLRWIASEHKQYLGHHEALQAELRKREGMVIHRIDHPEKKSE